MNLNLTKSIIFLKKLFSISKPIYLVIIFLNILFFNIDFLESKEIIKTNEINNKKPQRSLIALKDIEKLLIENNQELFTLAKLIEASNFNLKSKLSKRYPTIDIDIDGLPQYLNGRVYNNKKFNTKSSQLSVNPSLSINWDLIDPQRGPEIKLAKDSLQIAKNNYQIKIKDLLQEARSRYHNYQKSFEDINSANTLLNSSIQSLIHAEARMKSGLGSKLDVLEAKAQLVRDEQFLEDKREEFFKNEISIKEILNIKTDIQIKKDYGLIGYWPYTLRASLKNGLKNNISLKNIEFQKSLKENESNFLLNDKKPFIFISNTFSSSFARGSRLSQMIDYDEKESSYSNTLSLNFSWNIFDGGESKNSASAKLRESEAESYKFSNFSNILEKDIIDTYYDLILNKKRLVSTKKEVDFTKEALRLSRLKYEEGITNLRELINVQKDLAKSKENQIAAVAIYNLNLDKLERLTGLKPINNCYANNALIKKDYLYTICNL